MDQMLDAGFWILDFKRKLSLFIQHPVSSIQYLANCGINDRFHDVVIFGSGLSGLGFKFLILDNLENEFYMMFLKTTSQKTTLSDINH